MRSQMGDPRTVLEAKDGLRGGVFDCRTGKEVPDAMRVCKFGRWCHQYVTNAEGRPLVEAQFYSIHGGEFVWKILGTKFDYAEVDRLRFAGWELVTDSARVKVQVVRGLFRFFPETPAGVEEADVPVLSEG